MTISLMCIRPARTLVILGVEIGNWGYFLAVSTVSGIRPYSYRMVP